MRAAVPSLETHQEWLSIQTLSNSNPVDITKNITPRRRKSPSALLFGAVGTFALTLLLATTVEARPWGRGGPGERQRKICAMSSF